MLPPLWFFGGVDSSTGRVFIELVDKRNSQTLFPIIQRFVKAYSTIHSDQWAAYKSLYKLGYTHGSVNHKYNFVDDITGVHTQMIECVWHHLKLWLRSKNITNRDAYQKYVHEWCYRRNLAHSFNDFWNLIRFQ